MLKNFKFKPKIMLLKVKCQSIHESQQDLLLPLGIFNGGGSGVSKPFKHIKNKDINVTKFYE